MRQDIWDRLVHNVLEFLAKGPFRPDEKVDEMGLDSLDFIQLKSDIEDEFKIEVGIDDLATCNVLSDVTALIEGKI